MELSDIKGWLEKKGSYKEGVRLYDCFGSNQALKDLFAKGEMSFTRQKLRTTLEQLLQESQNVQVSGTFVQNRPETVQISPETVTETSKTVTRTANPDSKKRLRPLLDERTLLHAQLEYEGPLTRVFSCLRIVELTKQISAIYFNLEKPVVDPLDFSHITDRAELQQKLDNLRCLRSKIKKNPKRQEELPLLEAQINTVSQLLKPKTNDN